MSGISSTADHESGEKVFPSIGDNDPEMHRILAAKPGTKVLLLGNEAVARGALEAGVSVATTYPGTPASEIGDTFARVAPEAGLYFEYSVNEKVATEVAIGAATSGVRAMVSMKHVGVNVAADPLMTFAYTGTRGGFVIVTADDPSCHSSQNEQDNRFYALFGGFPLLEPSTPQECLDMTRRAFDISEELEMPVMLRTTTRIAHVRAPVQVGPLKKARSNGEFLRDPARFVPMPSTARERHLILLQKLEDAERLAERSEFNLIEGDGTDSTGIITSSVVATYARDALKNLDLEADVLKLGFSNPLPRKKVIEFLRNHEEVIVIEELEPILEMEVRALAQRESLNTRILGKADGKFPRAHEFTESIVAAGLSRDPGTHDADRAECASPSDLPMRPPVLCAGCPHSATYFAFSKAIGKKAIYASDIGCYTLGVASPYSAADLLVCMGSSVGTAGGLAMTNDLPIIAFIGDSTFFHAGVPGLINAVHQGHKFLLVILDNRTTAMTGHQPHPGSPPDPRNPAALSIIPEDVVRGCGVKWLRIVDPYDIDSTVSAINEAVMHDGVSVMIARRECALIAPRDDSGAIIGKHQIDQDACKKCRTCVTRFQCPAISSLNKVQTIDDSLCAGCGVCAKVCPYGAIKEVM